MFEAQLLYTDAGASSSYDVLSPWMPRGGDDVIMTLDLIKYNGGLTFAVQMLTKNSEDTGDGDAIGTAISKVDPTNPDSARYEQEVTGVDELIRYKFTVTKSGSTEGWVLFRMLEPVWSDAVAP